VGFEGLVEAEEEVAATVKELAVDIAAEEEVAALDHAKGGGEFALEFLLEFVGCEEMKRVGVRFAGFDLLGSESPEAIGWGAEEDASVLCCGENLADEVEGLLLVAGADNTNGWVR